MKIEIEAGGLDVVRHPGGGVGLYLGEGAELVVINLVPARSTVDLLKLLESAVSAEWSRASRPAPRMDVPGYDANGSPVP